MSPSVTISERPIPAHLAFRPAEGTAEDPEAIQTMVDRGLVRIGRNLMGRPAAFFTETGLESLCLLLQDRRGDDRGAVGDPGEVLGVRGPAPDERLGGRARLGPGGEGQRGVL